MATTENIVWNQLVYELIPSTRVRYDTRGCERAWVTAKQIENWSGMSTKTLWRRLNELEECERISRGQDFNHVDIPTETGAVIKDSLITAADGKSYRTKLYNLEMLITFMGNGRSVESPLFQI